MNAYKLTEYRQQYLNQRLSKEQYDKLDELVHQVMGYEKLTGAKMARAYRAKTSDGVPSFRINPVGAIRRLQDVGVNWQKELGIRKEATK